MRLATAFRVSVTSLLFAVAAQGASDESSRPSARETALAVQSKPGPAVQGDVTRRLAQAAPLRMVAPLWQLDGRTSTDLYLINMFSEAIDAQVSVLDPRGRVVGNAFVTVETARHQVLPLASLVGSSIGAPSQGSLRLEYVGDEDMLQAWVVWSDPGGVTEAPLKKVSADTARRLTSFWDLRRTPSRGGEEVRFWLVNGGAEALPYRVEAGDGARLGRVLEAGVLHPGEQRLWEPRGAGVPSTHGMVSFVHDGAPGSLVVAGLVQGREVLANLPIVTPETRLLSPEYHAIRVPFFPAVRTGLGEAVVTLANTSDRTQAVAVQIVAAGGGGELFGEGQVEIRPGEVRSVDLGGIMSSPEAPGAEGLRVMIRGELPGLLVSGIARDFLTGETTELAFFAREKAHPSGSYPIPDPKRADVYTTLVNLGEEETRIIGQVYWDGGTYSIGPVVIPAGASHTVDFRRLAALGDEDLADRTLPPSFSGGFFHWTVQGGNTELIARTEVAPQGGRDAFGFNCTTCCFEESRGAVIPGSTTFPFYSTGGLEGVEFVDTCMGTMGPFSLFQPSYQYEWPLSWNGTTVSASAPAVQDLGFSATGHRMTFFLPCSEIPITIFGVAPATATKVTILGVSLPDNRIRVRLEPADESGTLEVKLTGPSQRTLVNTTYSSGDHTIGFGNLSGYTAGQEFSRVTAKWTVNGTAASTTFNYAFKVLGSYDHTRYNTPISNINCSGSPVSFCYFSGDCINVQCTGHQVASAPSNWFTEVAENGSGKHAHLGYMTPEGWCSHPANCSVTYRKVSRPCPKCLGKLVVPNKTVAFRENHPDITCGSQLFVDSVGIVEAVDNGGGLAPQQLDHYAGDSGCNQVTSIGFRMTFLLR